MTVKQFLAGPIGTNCYLLINEKTKEAVIVDPASCPDYMMNYIKTEEIKLKAVLLTHAHFDHIMGIDDVLNKYGKMPVYVHEADKPMLEDPQQNMTMSCGFPYAYKGAQAVQDGQVLSLIGYEIKALHTPGTYTGRMLLLYCIGTCADQWRYAVPAVYRKNGFPWRKHE